MGLDFVINYNDGSWDNNGGNDYFIPIQHINPISLDLKVFLEGPFNGVEMNTDLTNSTILPLNQPYNDLPWNYNGTENVVAIPSDVVDWILVELRDATDAASANESTSIAKQAAFLKNDGSVVGLDGISNLYFPYSPISQLFVVIWHRNHLPVLSNYPLGELSGIYAYDFRSGIDKAYPGTLSLKELASGTWGMISGDSDASGMVNQDDKTVLWETKTGLQGYLGSDLNLDTEVNNQDKNEMWLPNLGAGSQVPQ